MHNGDEERFSKKNWKKSKTNSFFPKSFRKKGEKNGADNCWGENWRKKTFLLEISHKDGRNRRHSPLGIRPRPRSAEWSRPRFLAPWSGSFSPSEFCAELAEGVGDFWLCRSTRKCRSTGQPHRLNTWLGQRRFPSVFLWERDVESSTKPTISNISPLELDWKNPPTPIATRTTDNLNSKELKKYFKLLLFFKLKIFTKKISNEKFVE